MLPGIGPGAVIQRIAHAVIGDGYTVVGRQQVAPLAVAVGVDHFRKLVFRLWGAVGIGVNLTLQDVTGIIVGPKSGGSCLGMIFPDQLIGCVIPIVGDVIIVVGIGDIATGEIAVGKGGIIVTAIVNQLERHAGGSTGGIADVSNGLGHNRDTGNQLRG